MKELVERTGVAKSTILHYVSLDLLPRPKKTSPNMAWYDEKCVDLIALIKDLQNRFRLSLADIKSILEKNGGDPAELALMNLNDIIYGGSDEPLLNRADFCRATGLTPDQLDRLEQAQIILPLVPGRYDGRDVAFAQGLADTLKQGLEISDMAYYPRLGRELVEEEMALRNKLTGHLDNLSDAVATARMAEGARRIREYVFDRLFQLRIARMTGLKDKD